MGQKSFSKSDFAQWERFYRASFFNSLGGYKSLNVMLSQSEQGLLNAGLFFSVIHVGANPPYLGLLFRPHTVPRHSLENFKANGFASLNSVNPVLLPQAHACSANFAADESEVDILKMETSHLNFPVPYLKESPVKIGISYVEEHQVKVNGTIFVVAAIEEVHLDESLILEDGLIEHSKAGNLAVNGLDSYYKTEPFKRYAYARPHKDLEHLPWEKE